MFITVASLNFDRSGDISFVLKACLFMCCCIMAEEQKTRKRKSYGRMQDVTKKLRLSSHETGKDCKCLKLKCFQNFTAADLSTIVTKFNQLQSYDEQSLYLSGLITCKPVSRHRPRKSEEEADFHSFSYTYKIRFLKNNELCEIPVCYKAFLALHGITAKRLQTIQSELKSKGSAPIDMRGKHSSRPNRLSREVTDSVMEHIRSFKSRKSHYGLAKTTKVYLPAELNIKKMYSMYKEKYPHRLLSYEKYREIFNTKFNIAFGYPRCDTCSTCDVLKVKIDDIEKKLNQNPVDDFQNSLQLHKELRKLQIEKELHLKRADTFYMRKKAARTEAQKDKSKETIVMDFQKNLHLPNITTNDTYYRRQLSFYMFNIHVLSTSEALFYTYTEVSGKKGADDVASQLWDYIFNHLDFEVKELTIFCDSCCGQNKNFTVFRMLHYIVHFVKRLRKIKVVFPIRGHSYLECDRNMGLVNQKTYVELPQEWNAVLRNSRSKPTPFKVVSCEDQSIFKSWTNFLSEIYMNKCPFPSRPVRELTIIETHPRMMIHRESYNGPEVETVVIKQKRKRLSLPEKCFLLPSSAYDKPIPIPKAKFDDLQHLKRFCSQKAQAFFTEIPHC